MPGMDAALADELRALRARAYGRDADLAHDSEAMRRLRELEALQAASTSAGAGSRPTTRVVPLREDDTRDAVVQARPADRASVSGASVIDATLAPLATREDDERDTELSVALGFDADHDPARVDRPRALSRRLVALWVGSVVAAAAVASTVTSVAMTIAPVSTSSGAAQIDTLTPTSSPAFQPDAVGGAEDSPVWEYHGLTLYLGVGGAFASDEPECLWLFVSDPGSSNSDAEVSGLGGWGSTGCSAGGFPATITLPLRDDLPDELLAAFPDGTALQFVLDGDRIGVFLDSE